ncbi:MAG: DUF1439 domain-containing protein [Verrucomicrobiae bacterium]|nr:DUF1439 domain-containing protein [Verrucomicrobiae bacterium]
MKRAIGIVLVLAFLAGGTWLFLPHTVVFSEKELQERLSKLFPIKKPMLLFFEVEYHNPVLELPVSGDRVKAQIQVTARRMGGERHVTGQVIASGALCFDPEQESFFLKAFHVESSSLDQLPPSLAGMASNFVDKMANEWASTHPVISRADWQKSKKGILAFMKVKEVKFRDKEVHVTLGF